MAEEDEDSSLERVLQRHRKEAKDLQGIRSSSFFNTVFLTCYESLRELRFFLLFPSLMTIGSGGILLSYLWNVTTHQIIGNCAL